MRHRNANKKLGRRVPHRLSMLKNQVVSLLKHGTIQTTEVKAKETRRLAERVIRIAAQDSAHRRRLASLIVREPDVLKELFMEIGPKYESRPGGYTRILKTGKRVGDNAPMCILSLVEQETAGE